MTKRLQPQLVHSLSLATPLLSKCHGSILPRSFPFCLISHPPWYLAQLPPPSPELCSALLTNPLSLYPSNTPQLTLNPIQSSFFHILLGSQQVTGPVTWCYLEIISEWKKSKGKPYLVSLRKYKQESIIISLYPACSSTKRRLGDRILGVVEETARMYASFKDPSSVHCPIEEVHLKEHVCSQSWLTRALSSRAAIHRGRQPIMLAGGHLSFQPSHLWSPILSCRVTDCRFLPASS